MDCKQKCRCTCTPDQFSQCHKRCDRVASDADFSEGEHIEETRSGDKVVGVTMDMYGHYKLVQVPIGSPSYSELTAAIETITLERDIALSCNRELREALEKIAAQMTVSEFDGTSMFPELVKECKERILIARKALNK